MELEELKDRWSSLEDQLKKQELLNEKLIQEIRQSKSGPLNVLINYGYFGIVLCAAAFILVVYLFFRLPFGPVQTSIFTGCLIILAIPVAFGIYNIVHLKKIDFTKSVSENVRLVETYKINYKKQLIASYIVIAVFIVFCVARLLSLPNYGIERFGWTLGIALLVGSVLAYLEYKKIFKAKTNEIMKSLEKLKELEG